MRGRGGLSVGVPGGFSQRVACAARLNSGGDALRQNKCGGCGVRVRGRIGLCWQRCAAARLGCGGGHRCRLRELVRDEEGSGADAVGAGGARARVTLEAIPGSDSDAGRDYARAMDAYRAIYYANPADVHAPAAVNAVAELLAEQGRGYDDAQSLKAAVGQYEFLRTQYPGSSLRVPALLAEGQIEENDLNDAAAARERYKLLLKEYPRSEQAEEAKAGLASLEQLSVVRSQLSGKAAGRRAAAMKEGLRG